MRVLTEQAVVRGGFLTSLLWLGWFQRDPNQKLRRELVISTLAATITSLFTAQIIRSFLPFRLRPLHDAAVHFTLPYHVSSDSLWNLSSFPSDTTAFAVALSVGVLLMWRRWGWLAILYTLVAISIPRIYLGYHYPTDVVVGALIGSVATFAMTRERIRIALSRRLLLWSSDYPGAFYCLFFLVTCEVAAVFENARQILAAAGRHSNLF